MRLLIPLGLLLVVIIVALIIYPGRLYRLRFASRPLIEKSLTFSISYTLGDKNNPPLRYTALGDSTAVGTGASNVEGTYVYQVAKALADKGNFVTVTNLGVNGATYHDVDTDQLPKLKDTQPDVITISAGANDVTHHTPPEVYQKDIEDFVKGIQTAAPEARVLVANTPEMGMVPAFPPPYPRLVRKRANNQNAIFDDIIKNTSFKVVDLHGAGQLDPQKSTNYYAADWFHPSDDGYLVWARVFIAKIY